MSPACLISRVEREIILDSGIQAARKSDFQYVRTFTDRCQLGFKPCTNQTNKAEINLNDSLAVLAHEMYLLLRRQYSSLTFLVFKMLCFCFVIGIFLGGSPISCQADFCLDFLGKCLDSNETSSHLWLSVISLPHGIHTSPGQFLCLTHVMSGGRDGWLREASPVPLKQKAPAFVLSLFTPLQTRG